MRTVLILLLLATPAYAAKVEMQASVQTRSALALNTIETASGDIEYFKAEAMTCRITDDTRECIVE